MWVVLCAASDAASLWAARGLAQRGLEPLEIVTAEALAYNIGCEHRICGGMPSTRITLADGRVIDSATVRGVLNRLQCVPALHLRTATPADQLYAEQEIHALYLSWLYGLACPVLNRPAPRGLMGDWRHTSEWYALAARAGLPTLDYDQSDLREGHARRCVGRLATLVVAGGSGFGADAPSTVTASAVRLATICTTSLLGLEFVVTGAGRWLFADASPFPDLRLGGGALLDALARALKS